MRKEQKQDVVDELTERLKAAETLAQASGPPDTVPTCFPSIDRLLGGGRRRRDLVVLGGDVGSGKSALALGIALRAAGAGHTVAFLSGEMDEDRLLERALAIESRTRIDDMRRGALSDEGRSAVGAAAAKEVPEVATQFRLPPNGTSGQDLLTAARGMLERATAQKDLLVKWGMSEKVLEELSQAYSAAGASLYQASGRAGEQPGGEADRYAPRPHPQQATVRHAEVNEWMPHITHGWRSQGHGASDLLVHRAHQQRVRDHAAHRDPDHMRGSNFQSGEKRSRIFGKAVHAVRSGGLARASVSAQVVGDNLVFLREIVDLQFPIP